VCSPRTVRKSGNRGRLGPCVRRWKSGGRCTRSSSADPVVGAVQGFEIPTAENHRQHDLRRKRSRGLLSGLLFLFVQLSEVIAFLPLVIVTNSISATAQIMVSIVVFDIKYNQLRRYFYSFF